MNSIETAAVETYKNNLAYFQKHQKVLYEKFAALDSALDQSLYESRYDLIVKDDYFDVVELSTKNYLYNSDSNEYAKIVAKSINFEKSYNAFETFKEVHIEEPQLQKYAAVGIEENNLSGFAPILYYVNKHKPDTSTLQEIKKFVFFGVGLGGHIVTVDKKISASVYLIVEDDLELFKLSLFTTPYYDLALRAELIFSVFDSTEFFREAAQKFIDTKFYYNHYIKYFHMLSHSEQKLKEFHIITASQSHNLFYYDSILKQFTRPLEYLKSGYNFLNLVKLNSKDEFGSKPVILLAAGPSLQKNIAWLKKNHNRFIIVALSATLSLLEKNDISPDIVTHLDGLDTSAVHFTKLKSYEFLKNTTFLLSARTQRAIVDLLNKENIFFFENSTSYKKDFGNISAACAGSTTYLLLVLFNIQELYLLGLDLALDSKTGATHSSEHEYTKKLDLSSAEADTDTLEYKHSLIKCPGNFTAEVFTTLEYQRSIDSVATTSVTYKHENQNIYNLNDGALFANTISAKVESLNTDLLKTMDKLSAKDEIHTIFTSNSSSKITDDELKSLEEKKEYSLKIKNVILAQESNQFGSYKQFLDSLVTLQSRLSSSSSIIENDLSFIYKNYFLFIYTFIFDFFNTKELSNKEGFTDEVNHLLCTQLLRIVKKYEKDL